MPYQKKRVVIIGAGMAGLAAARYLIDKGDFDVTVLEANPNRYGGRIDSFEVPGSGGKVADFGAMWIHGGTNENHPLTLLCQRYNIETINFHIWKPGRFLAFDEQGRPFSLQKQEQRLTAMLQLEEKLESAKKRLVESKLADFSIRTLLDETARGDSDFANRKAVEYAAVPFLESYMASIADDLSVKFLYGVPGSAEHTEFDGEDLVIPSGYKTLLDKIVTTGRPFSIELDRRVERVSINENRSAIDILSADRQNNLYQYIADHVIIAVPLGVLKSRTIHFEPGLPQAHLRAIDRIGFGGKTKILLVYDKPFWPDTPIIYVESKRWPIFFMNLQKINGVNGLLVTLDAVETNLAEAMSDQVIIALVIERLATIVDEAQIKNARLIYSKVVKWTGDPLTRGAYSFGKIGMKTEDAYAIRKPLRPYLFFAGEHTQLPEGEPGTVQAAYMSGERAAEEIMSLHKNDSSTHLSFGKKAML